MKNSDQRSLKGVALIGLAVMLLFGTIAIISDPFEYDQVDAKPILAVVALLVVATTLSIWAIRVGLGVADGQKRLFWLILTMGIGFRVVMLLTPPILEVDYYRYLWDGQAVQAGVSPYRYAPQTVIDTNLSQAAGAVEDQELETLAELASSFGNYQILSRVHYPELTTLYPPVSQAVFWAVARIMPADSSVWLHVLTIRAAFVLFDLGTVLLLAMLLKRFERHLAWLIAYAWNPLVIKEIANSGHLDSLAVFLMVSAVFFLLNVRSDRSRSSAWISGLALGLAVGAKLFPIILVPAFAARLSVYGWRNVTSFCLAFLITCIAVLYPMSNSYVAKADVGWSEVDATHEQQQLFDQTSEVAPDGLTKFLSTWRMNDAIFSGIYYNLKPNGDTPRNYWYVVTPGELRQQVAQLQNQTFFGSNPAYNLTRSITLSIFAVVYLAMLRRFRSGDEQSFLCGLLVVLFSFLMLQPTINPWYWVWVVPFTCFSSRWSWPAISGVLLIYYTRFYFTESDFEFDCLQQSYAGVEIFDHFVVWIELILIAAFVAFAGRLDVESARDNPTT